MGILEKPHFLDCVVAIRTLTALSESMQGAAEMGDFGAGACELESMFSFTPSNKLLNPSATAVAASGGAIPLRP